MKTAEIKPFIGHQGDVQFKQIPELPENAKEVDPRPVALGTTSPNHHFFTGDFQLYEQGNTTYVKVGPKTATLVHGDINNKNGHGRVTFPEGVFMIAIHQEYNPFLEELENTLD